MNNTRLTYQYTPSSWRQDYFLSLGGFSIVFFNYNKGTFIRESVSATLGQDFPCLEMFFMDDASTDGSGDIMESIVKKYRGPHKVYVLRNVVNQHIIGQWNTVVRLSTGYWLGMFCGDDIPREDRVLKIAKRIRDSPSLKGICTAVREVSQEDNFVRNKWMESHKRLIFQSGLTGVEEVDRVLVVGASAWWHKSLFERALPQGPLDDVILRWILHFKNLGTSDNIWLWDGVEETIDYCVGSGISTQYNVEAVKGKYGIQLWMARVNATRHLDKMYLQVWEGLKKYLVENNFSHCNIQFAESKKLYYRIRTGTTLSRLMCLPRLLWLLFAKIEIEWKKNVFRIWVKLLIRDCFGLYFAALTQKVLRKV